MTAAVEAVVQNGKRKTVRPFINQGAQASFVTADLVHSLLPPKLKEGSVALPCFSTTDNMKTSVDEFRIMKGYAGIFHTMNVIK